MSNQFDISNSVQLAVQCLKAVFVCTEATLPGIGLAELLEIERDLKTVLARIQSLKPGASERTIQSVIKLVESGHLDSAVLLSQLQALAPRNKIDQTVNLPRDQKLTAPYKSPVRFRDEVGHVWSGRGPKPAWVKSALAAGASLNQFSVEIEGDAGTVSFDASVEPVGNRQTENNGEIFEGFRAGLLDSGQS